MATQPNNIFENIDFIIPVFVEHEDRLRNLKIAVKYLSALGCKNIFINEYYKESPKARDIVSSYISKNITNENFYNKMACGNEVFDSLCTKEIVCLYDTDVLIAKKDFIDCFNKLTSKEYDFAYPYNGKFYDIPNHIVNTLKEDLYTPIDVEDCILFAPASHGGCVMFRRECFIEGGKLNPNFKNVGYDDDEINVRFSKLGYKKYRSNSPLMHMTHYRGETSYNYSKFVNHNGNECGKVNAMTVEDLKSYIKLWHANG